MNEVFLNETSIFRFRIQSQMFQYKFIRRSSQNLQLPTTRFMRQRQPQMGDKDEQKTIKKENLLSASFI